MEHKITEEQREKIARGLAEKFAGWSDWESDAIAAGPNGNEPHEERQFWRDVVSYVYSGVADGQGEPVKAADSAQVSPAGGREPVKVQPGDEVHLTLLMAPFGLNFFTGNDREHLLAWGRSVWQAALAARLAPVQCGYVLEDDKFPSFLDGQQSRFSIHRGNGEHLAWIAGENPDGGESIAREIMLALTDATLPINETEIDVQVELAAEKAIQVIVAMKKSGLFIALPNSSVASKERVRSLIRLLAFDDAEVSSQTDGVECFEQCAAKVFGWVESSNSMLGK